MQEDCRQAARVERKDFDFAGVLCDGIEQHHVLSTEAAGKGNGRLICFDLLQIRNQFASFVFELHWRSKKKDPLDLAGLNQPDGDDQSVGEAPRQQQQHPLLNGDQSSRIDIINYS